MMQGRHGRRWRAALACVLVLAASRWAGAGMSTLRLRLADPPASRPAEGGEGIVRFDLSALPRGARVYRADLLVFRDRPISAEDKPDQWAMTVNLAEETFRPTCTVDVTARHCKAFRQAAGDALGWTNTT